LPSVQNIGDYAYKIKATNLPKFCSFSSGKLVCSPALTDSEGTYSVEFDWNLEEKEGFFGAFTSESTKDFIGTFAIEVVVGTKGKPYVSPCKLKDDFGPI